MKNCRYISLLLLIISLNAVGAVTGIEPPLLEDKVAAGELDAMQDRLPLEPYVTPWSDDNAQYGGL